MGTALDTTVEYRYEVSNLVASLMKKMRDAADAKPTFVLSTLPDFDRSRRIGRRWPAQRVRDTLQDLYPVHDLKE
ncbi:hypothetical protein SAMN05216345_111111 [Cupriavidus sp. YR651]|nr:hypothetical protein SAMN05216345_111111 [Cupriavidus sp. YR651]